MKRWMTLFALLAILCGGIARAADVVFSPTTSQRLTYGCTPTCAQVNSSAVGAQTRLVRVVAVNATGYMALAASGATLLVTAATGIFMPLNVPEVFKIPQSGRIGFLANSASGFLHITEVE